MFPGNHRNYRARNSPFIHIRGDAHITLGPNGISINDDYNGFAMGAGGLNENADYFDPPPPYSEHRYTPNGSSSRNPQRRHSQGSAHFNNRTHIHKINGDIYGQWTVEAPLSASPHDSEQLSLQAMNGCIEGSVTIAPFPTDGQTRRDRYERAMMRAIACNGHVSLRVNANNSINRPFFHFHITASNGEIRLRLPRTFQGPIQASASHGTVKFSEGLVTGNTRFTRLPSDSWSTRRAFVGDPEEWEREQGRQWGGDEVVVESSNGSVEVMFADEARFRAARDADEDHRHPRRGGGTHFDFSGVSFTSTLNGFVFHNGTMHATGADPTGHWRYSYHGR